MGNNTINIILYADDVVLLSNSALGLQEIIRVVEQYGSKNEVKFNVAKTNILIFHNKKRISRKSTTNMVMDSKLKFRLDKQLIPVVHKIKYLGIWMNRNLTPTDHISEKIRGHACKMASLEKLGMKLPSLSPIMKGFYYKIYVRPYLLYGLDLFKLTKEEKRRIKSAKGNAIKECLGLPKCLWTTVLFLALNLHGNFPCRNHGNNSTKTVPELVYEINGK